MNTRSFAQALQQNGQSGRAEEVIFKGAAESEAPKWFLGKAAYCLARQERYGEAVTVALQFLKP
jgi:hypothetical protein